MLFNDNEIEVKIDWNIVPKLKGNYDALKYYFPDPNGDSYSFVGNHQYVITRDKHPNGNITFSVYDRDSFIKSQNYFLWKNKQNID